MQISIITSLFNRLDLTRAVPPEPGAHPGWLAVRGHPHRRRSTDGTREFLAGLTIPVTGWFSTTRRAVSPPTTTPARGSPRAPLLGFLNNDLVLRPGWLEPMARLAQALPDVACVGNVQREPVGGVIDHLGFYFNADGDAVHAGKGRAVPPAEPYLEWPALTAACWVVRREVFLGLGGFDEAFHNGCEDLDFCLRAAAAGYRHFVANRSVIYHHISASPGRKQHEDENHRLFRERWRRVARHGEPAPAKRRPTCAPRAGATCANTPRVPGATTCGGSATRWKKFGCHGPPPANRTCSPARRFRLHELRCDGGTDGRTRRTRPTRRPPPTTRIFLVVGDTARDARQRRGADPGAQFGGRVRSPGFTRAPGRVERRLALPVPAGAGVFPGRRTRKPCATRCRRGRRRQRVGGFPVRSARGGLANGPSAGNPALHEIPRYADTSTEAWVLLPEIMHGKEEAARLVAYAHRWRWRVAVIFHDAIPFNAPVACRARRTGATRRLHARVQRGGPGTAGVRTGRSARVGGIRRSRAVSRVRRSQRVRTRQATRSRGCSR